MRPVDKGPSPSSYSDYRDAYQDLLDRIGDYCSYCERQIETNLAIEHIQPKSKNPLYRTDWANFLFGCVNCNSCKGDTSVDLADFFWPDMDNTLRAFDYLAGGLVVEHPGLSHSDKLKAQKTIDLCGLDRDPGQTDRNKQPSKSDRRYLKRREIWNLAQLKLQALQDNNTDAFREIIVDLAKAHGLFSIWMKVFENDSDMRWRLIRAFRGTATACFATTDSSAIARIGGRL
jgi:uncharacterized protein (TIGR02646 family)